MDQALEGRGFMRFVVNRAVLRYAVLQQLYSSIPDKLTDFGARYPLAVTSAAA